VANIGMINGGTVRNAIPEKVLIAGESRSLSHQKCLHQAEEMKAQFEEGARAYGASASVKMELGYRAMRIPEDSRPVIVAKKAIEQCGLEPKTAMMTGGTDASIFNEKGIQMVILGMGVGKEHTVEEYADVFEMEKMVEILKTILDQFCS
jgi:tripeptide aminopeptidase